MATDLYELTMAQGYWKAGMRNREAIFHLFFRKNPFYGGFTIAAGITFALEFLSDFKFKEEDLNYLKSLQGNDGNPLFDKNFLGYLKELKIECDVDSVKEGTIVFPFEPILRVKGNIIQSQIIEAALLNIINFHSLIATKAARVCESAKNDPVIEFGMRRAHSFGGAIGATWAAYIGGCESTSNVIAGKLFNIPVRGTHAHSWVQCFNTERDAFLTYAKVMPNNSVFVVDTYNSIQGVKNAVVAGKWLVKNRHKLFGIRIDSGNLNAISRKARKILDDNGFHDTHIIASGDLDEFIISELKRKNAPIDIWGVGTKLATGFGDPALGGVYKLSMITDKNGKWQHRMKLSEDLSKPSLTGVVQIRRFFDNKYYCGDILYDAFIGINDNTRACCLDNSNKISRIPETAKYSDLLIPVLRQGKQIYKQPQSTIIREFVQEELKRITPEIRVLEQPSVYPVCMEKRLTKLRTHLVKHARK